MPLLALIITLKFVHTLTPYALRFWMLGGGVTQQGRKIQVPLKRNYKLDK